MSPASCPDETDPWTTVARVRKITAVVELHPEKAKPITKNPWTMFVTALANFRTFVRLILSFLSR